MKSKSTNSNEQLPATSSTSANSENIALNTEEPNLSTFIGQAFFIKGDVLANEDIFIDGRIEEGAIVLKNNYLGIGKNARLQTNAFAKTVVIEGEIRGDVYAIDRAILKKTSRVFGNIYSPDVSLEDGAFLKGKIDMKKPDFSLPHADGIEGNQQSKTFFDKMLEMTHFQNSPPKIAHKNESQSELNHLIAAHQDATQAGNPIKENNSLIVLPKKPAAVFPPDRTVIGENTIVKGEVVAEENALILGKIEGAIYSKNHSLEFGINANIKANPFAKSIIAHGEIDGDVYASEHILVSPSGKVVGKIFSPRISIESGAAIKGEVEMDPKSIERMFARVLKEPGEETKVSAKKIDATEHTTTHQKSDPSKKAPLAKKEVPIAEANIVEKFNSLLKGD